MFKDALNMLLITYVKQRKGEEMVRRQMTATSPADARNIVQMLRNRPNVTQVQVWKPEHL